MLNEIIKNWFGEYSLFGNYIALAAILVLAILVYLITKKISIKIAAKIILKSKANWDDYLLTKIYLITTK